MELISVIVPIYNVEEFLPECLDSILNQTYQNLEIILVDDGTLDRSGEICDDYARKDKRIIVIHQNNEGLVGARNSGLKRASGEYVCFIDSDDMISPVYCEWMLKIAKGYHADIAACGFTHVQENLKGKISNEYTVFQTEDKEKMIALITSAPSMHRISWTGCPVWNKLYRREKILIPFNKESLMCEDLQFNYDFIQNCRRYVTIAEPLNFYRINEEGICGTYRSNFRHKLVQGIRLASLWKKIAQQKFQDKNLASYLNGRAIYMIHGSLWRIYAAGSQKEYNAYIVSSRKFIHTFWKDFWKDKESYNLPLRLIVGTYCFAFPIWYLGTWGIFKIFKR